MFRRLFRDDARATAIVGYLGLGMVLVLSIRHFT